MGAKEGIAITVLSAFLLGTPVVNADWEESRKKLIEMTQRGEIEREEEKKDYALKKESYDKINSLIPTLYSLNISPASYSSKESINPLIEKLRLLRITGKGLTKEELKLKVDSIEERVLKIDSIVSIQTKRFESRKEKLDNLISIYEKDPCLDYSEKSEAMGELTRAFNDGVRSGDFTDYDNFFTGKTSQLSILILASFLNQNKINLLKEHLDEKSNKLYDEQCSEYETQISDLKNKAKCEGIKNEDIDNIKINIKSDIKDNMLETYIINFKEKTSFAGINAHILEISEKDRIRFENDNYRSIQFEAEPFDQFGHRLTREEEGERESITHYITVLIKYDEEKQRWLKGPHKIEGDSKWNWFDELRRDSRGLKEIFSDFTYE